MKRLCFLPLFCSLFILGACGRTAPPGRLAEESRPGIVHGKTSPAKNPLSRSVVALVAETATGQALCTGTLLGKDVVLTAAHCVEDSPQKISVVFGEKVRGASELRVADTFQQHPLWKKSSAEGHGDLALVHFAGGTPDGYSPVHLAPESFRLNPGDTVEMLGYGVTNGESHAGAGVLRETSTTVLRWVSETEVLTDGRTTSVCFGDSGGPAFAASGKGSVQWGVASSVSNSNCNEASVHTSVMKYRDWIKDTMAKMHQR